MQFRRGATVLLAVVVLAGCDQSEPDEAAQPVVEAVKTSEAATVEVSEASAEPEPEPEPASAPPEDTFGEPLGASRSGANQPLSMTLDALERAGETVNVTFSVTNNGDASWTPSSLFDGGVPTDDPLSFTTAGVSLIDTTNARRYPVLTDERGQCLCDAGLLGIEVEPDMTRRFSAVVGAPPPDVETVSVQIPGFGTFTDVPLQGS